MDRCKDCIRLKKLKEVYGVDNCVYACSHRKKEIKRECISCKKFYECKYKRADMDGCLHYERNPKA